MDMRVCKYTRHTTNFEDAWRHSHPHYREYTHGFSQKKYREYTHVSNKRQQQISRKDRCYFYVQRINTAAVAEEGNITLKVYQ